MPVTAFELEFYLIERERAPGSPPRVATSPVTGRRQDSIQVYGMDELDDFDPVLRDIAQAASVQGIPVDTALSEFAPGQFEVNLRHGPDPLLAADHAMLLKRLIKGVAARHGIEATFMAKPFATYSGNGMHVHVSLLDTDGHNLFAAAEKHGSETLRHAIGGLACTMGEAMAFFTPNANSYRRIQPGHYGPTSPSWGYDNRTVALRIPVADASTIRIEHRVAGADANPYLTLAAILAGIHHGITQEVDPGPPDRGNAYVNREPSLPTAWEDALEALARAAVLPAYFDPAFLRVYRVLKEGERRKFADHMPPHEYEWHLAPGWAEDPVAR